MEQQNATKTENPNQKKPKSQQLKLKVFDIIQKNLTIIGITPSLAEQRYPFNAAILFGFLTLISVIYCSLVFILYDAETFGEYTQSVYTGSIGALIILGLLILILKVEKVFKFINQTNDLVNTTLKYSASKSIFNETVQFEQKLSELIFFIVMKFSLGCAFLPFLIYTYFVYFTTDLGSNAFELPFPLWLPFDWKKPLGYLIAMTLQYVVVSYMSLIGSCVMTLTISSFLYVIASSKCIKGSLFSIGRSTNNQTRQHILDQFIEFMQFHSRVKQYFGDYSDIFEPFFTILFMWALVTICGSFLLARMQILHHSDNLAVMSITIFKVIHSFSFVLVNCELGQRVNLVFSECRDMIDQFEWYAFPMEIQRMLPLILNFMHQPIVIKYFGSKTCDRETFKRIIKTSYSYFTILREVHD